MAERASAMRGYRLEPGNFSLLVKIIEAQDLVAPGSTGWFSSEEIHATCRIRVLNRTPKRTKIIKSNNPLWNETKLFSLNNLTLEQLENESLTIEVLDIGKLMTKLGRLGQSAEGTIIGSCSIDLASIYMNFQHEYYRKWCLLNDPTDRREGK